MLIKKLKQLTISRTLSVTFVLVLLFTVALQAIPPDAFAATAVVSFIKQGANYQIGQPNQNNPGGNVISCSATYGTIQPSAANLGKIFGDLVVAKAAEAKKNGGSSNDYLVAYSTMTTAGVDHVSPAFTGNDFGAKNLEYIGGYLNTSSVTVITFTGATDPDPAFSFASANNGECSKIQLAPVSSSEWRAPELVSTSGASPVYYPFVMRNASSGAKSGQFTSAYWNTSVKNNATASRNVDLAIGGSVPSGGGGGGGGGGTTPVGNAVTGSWDNITQITMSNGDVYQKWSWDDKNEYFLISTTDTARSAFTWANAKNKSQTPLEANNNQTKTGQFCVPFIYFPKLSINVPNSNGAQHMSDGIAGAANLSAELYDVKAPPASDATNAECVPAFANGTGGNRIAVSISTRCSVGCFPNTSIWLYYSKDSDKFKVLFTAGASNEMRYIGEYTADPAHAAQKWYVGPTTGTDCTGKSFLIPQGDYKNSAAFPVQWNLADKGQGCAVMKPTVNVYAKSVDTATYDGVVAPNGTTAASNTQAVKVDCDKGWNPLTWIICPLVDGAANLANGLTGVIEKELNSNTNGINTAMASTSPTGGDSGIYQIWSTMRFIALSLLVIIALVMIISQAISVGPFDAYTVKKVMPRIVIAVIGISLAWPILKFLIKLSDDAGESIKVIINSAFRGDGNYGIIQFGAWQQAGTGLAIGAAFVALGALGVLTFTLTAAVAIFVGFATIVFRNILLLFIVVVSPIALLLWILPNTQRAWKLWYDQLLAVLLAFPIIIGIIYLGRAFASVAYTASQSADGVNGLAYQIAAFIAFFAPYFLLPAAFRLAGGFVATLGGVANDKSRGILDRSQKFRQAKMAQNWADMQAGNRYKGDGRIRSRVNRSLFYGSNAGKAGLDPRKMRSRLLAGTAPDRLARAMEKLEKDPGWAYNKGNEDYLQAGMVTNDVVRDKNGNVFYKNGKSVKRDGSEGAIAAHLEARGYRESLGDAGFNERVASIRNMRRDMSTSEYNAAAFVGTIGAGTGYKGGAGEMDAELNAIAGGDRAWATNLLNAGRGAAERAGRMDLVGGGFSNRLGQLNDNYAAMQAAGTDETKRRAAINTSNKATAAEAYRTKDPRMLFAGKAAPIERGDTGWADIAVQELDAAHNMVVGSKGADGKVITEEAKANAIDSNLAKIANIRDMLAQTSPEKAGIWAEQVMSRSAGGSNIREQITSATTDTSRPYHNYKYVYGSERGGGDPAAAAGFAGSIDPGPPDPGGP